MRIKGGSSSEMLSGNVPPSIGVSEELPYIEPVFSETGLPVDPEGVYEYLPEFEPFESDSGPPRM